MSLYGLRKYTRQVQNAIGGYSDLENSLREATNTDTWGPTNEQKRAILNTILSSSEDSFSFQSSYAQGVARYITDFLFKRIREYGKMTPKTQDSIYEVLKRNLVTKGYAFLIIVKCLSVLEYLLLNCFRTRGNEITFDIYPDIQGSKAILTRLLDYRVKVAYDGLNMQHEKQVHQATERVLKLIDDPDYLQQERLKLHPTLAPALGGGEYVPPTTSAAPPPEPVTVQPQVDLLDFDDEPTPAAPPVPAMEASTATTSTLTDPWADFGALQTATPQPQKQKQAQQQTDPFADLLQ